jgi:two-component system, sensor histidine kinase
MKITLPMGEKDQEFLNLRLKILAHAAIRKPPLMLLFSVFVCLGIKDNLSFQPLISWILLIQVVAIPHAIYGYWLLRKDTRMVNAERYYWIFVAFAVFNGAAAGVSAPLFFASISPAQQALITSALAGIVASQVANTGSSPWVLAVYSLTALLPLTVSWSMYGNDKSHATTWLVLTFAATMVIYARVGKKVLHQSFLIRRQRDEAYILLQQKNDEIIRANATVEKLAETKTRVLAAASHDLRQPLHALSIYSAVLSANPSPKTLNEIGHNIDLLVRSLGALLDALLDLSQLDSHSFPTQTSHACLAHISKKIAQEFALSIATKGLQLETSFLPAPVLSDPLILERMIRNLIDNAVKYTHKGVIRITTEVVDGKSIFILNDTGKGIAADQLGLIFEEFYQVDNPGRDRSQGLGLGLSIVQKMASLLSAELTIDSELGVGTSVSMRLPHHPLHGENSAPLFINDEQLMGKTILLIDDEYSIISSMSAILQMWGATTLAATDLSSALAVVHTNKAIDIIIADLRLSKGESGVDVVKQIHNVLGVLPTLIVTGETSSERLSAVKAYGFPVLQKPIPAGELFISLSRLLEFSIAKPEVAVSPSVPA